MGLAVRTARRSDGMGKDAAAARSNKYPIVKTSRRGECQQAVNIERCARETRIRPSGTGTGSGWGAGTFVLGHTAMCLTTRFQQQAAGWPKGEDPSLASRSGGCGFEP